MSTNSARVNSWEQGALFAGATVEVILRVGIVPSVDHAQFQLEVVDPRSHELLAMRSWPHVPFVDLPDMMAVIIDELSREIWDRSGPFSAEPVDA